MQNSVKTAATPHLLSHLPWPTTVRKHSRKIPQNKRTPKFHLAQASERAMQSRGSRSATRTCTARVQRGSAELPDGLQGGAVTGSVNPLSLSNGPKEQEQGCPRLASGTEKPPSASSGRTELRAEHSAVWTGSCCPGGRRPRGFGKVASRGERGVTAQTVTECRALKEGFPGV